eukprot:11171951-Lingulodinium_polyedra.AAC.1
MLAPLRSAGSKTRQFGRLCLCIACMRARAACPQDPSSVSAVAAMGKKPLTFSTMRARGRIRAAYSRR